MTVDRFAKLKTAEQIASEYYGPRGERGSGMSEQAGDTVLDLTGAKLFEHLRVSDESGHVLILIPETQTVVKLTDRQARRLAVELLNRAPES
jgi:hypothetical protein